MRKFILALLALVGLVGATQAQTITVADVTAVPGQTVTATLKATCPADTYTGMQFQMQFPAATGFSVESVSWDKGYIEKGPMNDGLVKFAGAQTNAFSAADIVVSFTVASTVATGSYDITITNILFEGSGQISNAEDVTFKLNVMAQMDGVEVTATDVEAVPGETVQNTLTFACPSDYFTGLRFSLQFPATGFSVESVSGWNGYIEKGEMVDGIVKFAAAGSSAFSNAEITLSIKVDESVAVGEYEVTVDNIMYEGSSLSVTAEPVTFKVMVVESHEIVLDADVDGDFNDFITENAGKTLNVKVVRTLPADEWSTIVLPFDLEGVDRLKAAFGEGVKVAWFTQAVDVKDENGNVTGIQVDFENDNIVYANTPMIIKVTSAYNGEINAGEVEIVAPTYDGGDEGNSGPENVTAQENYFGTSPILPVLFGQGDDQITTTTKKGKVSISKANVFIGTYKSISGIGDNNEYYVKNNLFWHANNAKAKPTRAYFRFDMCEYNGSSTPSSTGVRMVLHEDEEVTGIKTVDRTGTLGGEAIYSLQGVRVKDAVKGLYINNGKKYFIK